MGYRGLGWAFAILALVTISVPFVLFPVCGGGSWLSLGASTHGCHPTAYAESVLGLLLLATGVVLAVRPTRRWLLVSSAIALLIGALVALLPTALLGVCKIATMPCRLGTVPAWVTAGVLIGVAGIVGLITARRR